MKVLISAAESSSDVHGAELLKALQSRINVEAFGIGGPKLQAAGLKTVVDARELLAMGFVEILGHLPRIFKALKQVVEAAKERRPDVAVVIDYPDFHFRLAAKLKLLGIPVIYYIPPKVWVWRKSRVEVLRKQFIKLLCIFPFEGDFYSKLGISAKYVGNPLTDELPLHLSKSEARRKLNIGSAERVAVLMPGSRASELNRHLELMLDAAQKVALRMRKEKLLEPNQNLKVLLPFPVMADLQSLQKRIAVFQESLEKSQTRSALTLQVSQGNSAECLIAADAGLIKSGTSTLEAALLRCPHSVIYKPSGTTAWIFKNLIRYKGPVGLVNLVAGAKTQSEYLVSEILCENVTVESMSQELYSLFSDREKVKKQNQGFENLRNQMIQKESPSQLAATEVIQIFENLRAEGKRGLT